MFKERKGSLFMSTSGLHDNFFPLWWVYLVTSMYQASCWHFTKIRGSTIQFSTSKKMILKSAGCVRNGHQLFYPMIVSQLCQSNTKVSEKQQNSKRLQSFQSHTIYKDRKTSRLHKIFCSICRHTHTPPGRIVFLLESILVLCVCQINPD